MVGKMVNHEHIIDIQVYTDEQVHLNGLYSAQNNQKPKGLVILLHGWLGSDKSTYMLERGECLFQHGYDVFRLNMRDHGPTVPLNRGIFHGGRLNEAFQAVKYIADMKAELPVYIIGFSMGGSFALRMGWQQSVENLPIKNLKKIISVCPSVDPEKVTEAIDNSIIYRRYFCNKWKTNLIEKQKHFPNAYDFGELLNLKTCREITEGMIKKYSDYDDIDAYFADYQFSKEKLKAICVPITVITAADDPVIPVDSFTIFQDVNPYVDLHVTQYGGHVGYINALSGDSWLDLVLPSLLDSDFNK